VNVVTEAEWLACAQGAGMLESARLSGFLQDHASDRKLRLFAVACCRRLWPLLDEVAREAVRAAERFADGLAREEELRCWQAAAQEPRTQVAMTGSWAAGLRAASGTAKCGRYCIGTARTVAEQAILASPHDWERVAEEAAQADLLRDLFGPLPFRAVALSPDVLAWNNHTIPTMAQAIYWDRAFERMPILGDAFEDAGCTDQEVLSHLRGPGFHIRGCWLLDLMLGRE
jgi:hypothetical protein